MNLEIGRKKPLILGLQKVFNDNQLLCGDKRRRLSLVSGVEVSSARLLVLVHDPDRAGHLIRVQVAARGRRLHAGISHTGLRLLLLRLGISRLLWREAGLLWLLRKRRHAGLWRLLLRRIARTGRHHLWGSGRAGRTGRT